jgi:hypothetical protein
MGGGGRRGAKRETGGLTARKGKKGWGGWGGVGSGRQQRSRAGDDERKKRISFLVFFWTICFIFIERDVALLEGPKGPSETPGSGGAAVSLVCRSKPFLPRCQGLPQGTLKVPFVESATSCSRNVAGPDFIQILSPISFL